MSAEERRAAWASLRGRQERAARRHRGAPWVYGVAAVAAIVGGATLAHYGNWWGGVLVWAGVGLAGFAVVAFVRAVMGRLASRRDDLTPPGL